MSLLATCLAQVFEQTRGMAKSGAESFAAAFVQCVSLSIVIGLFFLLFTFTPAVYVATRNVYAYVYELDEPLLPLVTSGTVPQFSEFMFRVNIDPNSWFADTSQHIPFGFSTPWLIYMLLCAEYVRALTNRARYSLRGWSWDSEVEPRAHGQRFTERSKANA